MRHHRLIYIAFLTVSFIAIFALLWQWHLTSHAYDEWIHAETAIFSTHHIYKKQKPEKRVVKGLYLTAYSANNDNTRHAIIDLIDKTELNAVVIDIKDYTGYVLYDSDI
ncbi:MAG: hypothetical protein COU35_00515, partial [Candidatus Magasanikbacteria bacterium CG10_big_fil_rev_8_21_14_0_10_47_10]